MSLRRTLAAAVSGVAALALALAGTAAYAADGDGVRVVRPGQVVHAGHGIDLKLTRAERCVGTPGDWSCKSVTDGNQPPGSVSLQTTVTAPGTFYSPLYIGNGRAVRMTVRANGVTYAARVVKLAGRPGYATGYVWGPPQPGEFPHILPAVNVYNAAGEVLASL